MWFAMFVCSDFIFKFYIFVMEESQRIVTINQFLQFLENQNFNYAQKVYR